MFVYIVFTIISRHLEPWCLYGICRHILYDTCLDYLARINYEIAKSDCISVRLQV